VKYAMMARFQTECDLRLMARLLDASPSGFYAAQQRQMHPSDRAQANQRLLVDIRAAHTASHRRYGAPRVHAELRDQGIPCGHNRVARLMRGDGLRGVSPRRYRVTTQRSPHAPAATNLLGRRFTPHTYERDQVWVADVTYLPTGEGWLYLAAVLDLGSRRVLGWCADTTLAHSLTLRALQQALTLRRPAPGLIHHSDRGSQYTNAAYQRCLQTHGLVPSMSRVGDCWDNAVMESFFATLKTELLATAHWPTRNDAQRALHGFIDRWYNHQRRHSALGYLSPIAYERRLAALLIA
jgi:putative transposase